MYIDPSVPGLKYLFLDKTVPNKYYQISRSSSTLSLNNNIFQNYNYCQVISSLLNIYQKGLNFFNISYFPYIIVGLNPKSSEKLKNFKSHLIELKKKKHNGL